MTKEKKKILIVGTMPPPVGGVTASVKSVYQALLGQESIEVSLLSPKSLLRVFFIRPDVVHCNFSRPLKRLVAGLLCKLVGARVVHTIHGSRFNFSDFINILALKFADGLILLNKEIYKEFQERKLPVKTVLMTPIISGASVGEEGLNSGFQGVKLFEENSEFKYILVYAGGKVYRDQKEVYGLLFVGNLLPQLKQLGFVVIFIDIAGQYSETDLDPKKSGNFIHISHPVNFRAACKEVAIYCRPTSMDGNSVAVLEALDEGVPVLASDAVPRPEGVFTYDYGNNLDFLREIEKLKNDLDAKCGIIVRKSNLTSVEGYLEFINSV